MNRTLFFLFTTFPFLFGCAPQPSEEQKIAIEKEMIGCLFLVNESLEDTDSSPDVFSALATLVESPTFENKKWRLDTDDASQKDTVTVEFDNQETAFSCSFSTNSDGKHQIDSVLRNSEEVYDRVKNEKILEEKAKIKEENRLQAIKEWQEKGYSNASYKYYEKRHVGSKSSLGEPTLEVVCNPERLQVKFNDGDFRTRGQENAEFKFIFSDMQEIHKFDLTADGIVGTSKNTSLGTDVAYDEEKTHEFLDLLEASVSLEVGGVVFDIDDYSQVPCLANRKADLEASGKKFDNYLLAIEKAASESPTDKVDISKDKVTGETTYRFEGESNILHDIFSDNGSSVLGLVTWEGGKWKSLSKVKTVLATRQYLSSDETLGRLNIVFMEDSEKVEIGFKCQFDFSKAISNKYGNASEWCLANNPDMGDLRALGRAVDVRVSSENQVFDSIDGTDDQKRFIADLKRIAKIIATPE